MMAVTVCAGAVRPAARITILAMIQASDANRLTVRCRRGLNTARRGVDRGNYHEHGDEQRNERRHPTRSRARTGHAAP